jgi:hypothetical protein
MARENLLFWAQSSLPNLLIDVNRLITQKAVRKSNLLLKKVKKP